MVTANLISGNCSGVVIDAPGTTPNTYNQVLGNLIGTDATGARAVPNLRYGVLTNNAGSNFVQNNRVSNNALGIRMLYGATGNTAQTNTALSNQTSDLEDDNYPCANTWIDNTFGTALGSGQTCIQ